MVAVYICDAKKVEATLGDHDTVPTNWAFAVMAVTGVVYGLSNNPARSAELAYPIFEKVPLKAAT